MRKKKVIKSKHYLKIESKFFSEIVSKLINKVMKDGKKKNRLHILYYFNTLVINNTNKGGN